MNCPSQRPQDDHSDSKIHADEVMALQFCVPATGPQLIEHTTLHYPTLHKEHLEDDIPSAGPRKIVASVSENPNISKVNSTSSPLTLDIALHPQADLLVMLSSLLTRITFSNDNLTSVPDTISTLRSTSPLLAFHARVIPSISIQSYLTRILKYCPMSSDIFLSLLVYFDRMSHSSPDERLARDATLFTSTKQLLGNEHHPLCIDSYNVHRLVITGIVVASKFCSDVFYTNSRYAKVCLLLLIIGL